MTEAALSADEQIVLEIARTPKYQSKTRPGRILWSAAFADNDDWRAHFPHKDKAKRMLKELQLRGLFTIQQPELTVDEKLVLELANKYQKGNGLVSWKAAFEAHPEARERLSYGEKDPKGQKAMNIATSLRKRGLIAENNLSKSMKGRKHKPRQKRNSTPAPHLNGVHSTPEPDNYEQLALVVEAIIGDCRLCPRCGRDLEGLLRLSLMNEKLRQQLPVDGREGR